MKPTAKSVRRLFDIADEVHVQFEKEMAAVMAAVTRLTRAMVSEIAPDGVLLSQNNGIGSGQEVPHFHLHVVPRRRGSD
jgi:histidine triad (HIT) family protein